MGFAVSITISVIIKPYSFVYLRIATRIKASLAIGAHKKEIGDIVSFFRTNWQSGWRVMYFQGSATYLGKCAIKGPGGVYGPLSTL
jgi:hypothetical protein